MNKPSYVIISPVRDEQDHIRRTIESVAAQTILPVQWIIVDDGSSDNTGPIVEEASKRHPWIKAVHRSDRGFRKSGGGVIEAFYDGYRALEHSAWDYLVKLDGDLSFDQNYFEKCLRRFEMNHKLGIGGGVICSLYNGHPLSEGERDPKFHVRGATKIYRRQCWEAIRGLITSTGWDTLDELNANMLGWETGSFRDLELIQHRPTGSADGAWRNCFKNGFANYVVGYHPLFMFCKCLKRLGEKPYGIVSLALWCGYLGGYVRHVPRAAGRETIRYIRRQQLDALLLRQSLWSR